MEVNDIRNSDANAFKDHIEEEICNLPDENYGNAWKMFKAPFGHQFLFPKFPRAGAGIACLICSITCRPILMAVSSCLDPYSIYSPNYWFNIFNLLNLVLLVFTIFLDPGYIKRRPAP